MKSSKKNRSETKLKNNNILSFIVITVVSLALGLTIEVIFNMHSLSDNYERYLDMSDATAKGCLKSSDSYIIGKNGAHIRFKLDGSYVKKLEYGFKKDNHEIFANCKIKVGYYDLYGNISEKTIKDNNPYINEKSVVNINEKVAYFELIFKEEYEGIQIDYVKISNRFRIITERIMFFTALAFVLLMLFAFKNEWMYRVENIFLVFSVIAGTVFVVINPFVKIGWDEDVHFYRAYTLPLTSTVKMNEAIELYGEGKAISWPYNVPQSKEEKEEMAYELSLVADYRNNSMPGNHNLSTKENLNHIYNIGYLNQALGIRLAQMFKLDFIHMYMVGRWFNMITYSILMYFAIRTIKVGKHILSIIALMPTPMFIAVNYAYDPLVTGCISLALALVINEMVMPDKRMKIKDMVLFIFFMCLGCMPKAVYIPLILLGLFLKKEKFKDKKQYIIFKVSVGIAFFAMMSTFILPSLLSGDNMGDARGGATNLGEQLELIFKHPFGYVGLWLKEVLETFVDYTFGSSVFGLLGHIKVSPFVPLIILLVGFVIITDTFGVTEKIFDVKQKIVAGIILIIVIGLIWTALYLSFNPVGNNSIEGVQGRYYLPLLILFYLMLVPVKVKNNMNERRYHLIIYSTSILILFGTMYIRFLQPFCM